jgi:hypothetical protein
MEYGATKNKTTPAAKQKKESEISKNNQPDKFEERNFQNEESGCNLFFSFYFLFFGVKEGIGEKNNTKLSDYKKSTFGKYIYIFLFVF